MMKHPPGQLFLDVPHLVVVDQRLLKDRVVAFGAFGVSGLMMNIKMSIVIPCAVQVMFFLVFLLISIAI